MFLEGFRRPRLFLSPPPSMGGCLFSTTWGGGISERSSWEESGEICWSPVMSGTGPFIYSYVQALVFAMFFFGSWGKSGSDGLQDVWGLHRFCSRCVNSHREGDLWISYHLGVLPSSQCLLPSVSAGAKQGCWSKRGPCLLVARAGPAAPTASCWVDTTKMCSW